MACPPGTVPTNQSDGGKPSTADPDGGGGGVIDPDSGGGSGGVDAGLDAGPTNGGHDAGGDGGPGNNDTPFTAVIKPIADAPFGTEFALDSTLSVNPEGRVLTTVWQVRTPEGEDCAGELVNATNAIAAFRPTCRGEHTAVLTQSSLDGLSDTAEETFEVLNNPPVLSGLELTEEFNVGGVASLSADVSDADGDATTCTARLADTNVGDATGLVIPTEPSADCTFVIQTPARLEVWTIEVVASDGEDESMPATVQIAPRNNPPVLETMELDTNTVGYTCDGSGCVSETIRVTMTASDDVDAFETLVLTLEDTSVDAPEGTVLEATPVPGEHGSFDVVMLRDSPGPMAGTYRLLGRVTEVTAAMAASATLERELTITGQAPSISNVVAEDVDHAYDVASGRFTATVEVTFETADPENNLLTSSVALVSCPAGNYGSADCGGANLEIEETRSAGSLSLALSTTDLAKLAGEYAFSITLSDPDGQSAPEQQPVLAVLNAAPVRIPGAPETLAQSYVNGAHEAVFPFVQDPDGDPLVLTLTVVCPDASQTTIGGTCANGQNVSLSEDGELIIRGPAHASFLGNYVVVGDVTDGHETLDINATLEVTNATPSVTVTSPLSWTCDHQTTGTTVANAAGCNLAFSATISDANGDPILLATEDPSDDFAVSFGATQTSGSTFTKTFSVSTSLADFVDAFDAAQQAAVTTARFSVRDPFGAGPQTSTVTVELENRAPTVSPSTNAVQTCNHRTTGATVTNDTSANCRYSFSATITDLDGDPVTFTAIDPSDDFTLDFDGTTTSGDTRTVSFDVSLSLDDFIDAFSAAEGAASTTAQFRARDPLGAGPAASTVRVELENRVPVVTGTPGITPTECHHKTTGTTVTNDAGCEYTFSANVSDPDGDPLSLAGLDVDGTFAVSFGSPVTSGTTRSMSFDMSTTFEDFVNAFDAAQGNASATVQFQVMDALGAGPDFTVHPRLLNRAPVLSSKEFQNSAGTDDPGVLSNNQLDWTLGAQTGLARNLASCYRDQLNRLICPLPSTYRFSLLVDAADPDGDPLEVALALTCSEEHGVTGNNGASLATPLPLPAAGRIPLELPGSTGSCFSIGALQYYREWTLTTDRQCFSVGGNVSCNYTNPHVRCSLGGSSSSLTDGMSPTSLGADLSLKIRPTSTDTPVGCSN